MKSRMRSMLTVVIALVLALVAGACAQTSPVQTVIEKEVVVTQIVEKQVVVTATPVPSIQGPVNLQFTLWSSNEQHLAMLNGFAEAFKAQHPNVTVQFASIAGTDYPTKLAVRLAGSNPPDAGWMMDSLAAPFLEAGALLDLGPVVKSDAAYDFADLSEAAMSPYQSGDFVRGIPFSSSPHLVLYNVDLFEQAGVETPDKLYERDEWTWENLAAAAKTIKEKTGVYGFQTMQTGIYKDVSNYSLTEFLRAWGSDVWDAESSTCLLNTPESVAALQWYHDMVFKDESAVPPGEQVDFFSGDSAMKPAFLSQVGRLGEASFKWGVIRLPEGPAGWHAVTGRAAIVAFRASRNPEIAAEFVAFITNPENSMTMAQYFPSIRRSVLESPEFLESNPLIPSEIMQLHVIPSIASGRVPLAHVNFEKIRLAITPILDLMWVPGADIQASMDAACVAMQPLLNQ